MTTFPSFCRSSDGQQAPLPLLLDDLLARVLISTRSPFDCSSAWSPLAPPVVFHTTLPPLNDSSRLPVLASSSTMTARRLELLVGEQASRCR